MDGTVALDAALARLAAVSLDAYREARAVLPAIARHGDAVAVSWLNACSELGAHDPACGLAFIRGSAAVEEVAEEVAPWTEHARRFALWSGSAPGLAGYMDNLPGAYGVLGHSGAGRWAQIGLRWCQRHLESGTAYFNTPARDLSGRIGILGIEALATIADELYERRNLMLAAYLPGALRVRNLFGPQAVATWAQQGADLLQIDRQRGEAYFRLELPDGLARYPDGAFGYRLGDHQRVIAMLLDAWIGSVAPLRESVWSPGDGRAFIGIDADALYLPAVLPGREDALLGSLHAAGHLQFGTFDLRALAELADATAQSPQGPGELLRAALATWQTDLPRFLLCFDLCEDLRVDARVGAAVPNYLARMIRLAGASAPTAGPAQVCRDLAVASLRLAAGENEPGFAPEVCERLQRLLDPAATVADAFRCAGWLCARAELPDVAEEHIGDAYFPARGPNLSRVLGSAGKRGAAASPSPVSDPERAAPGSPGACGAEPADAAADRSDLAARAPEAGTVGPQGTGARQRAGGRTEPALPHPRGYPYPEWNYLEGRYRRDWAWVQERPLPESSAAEAARLAARHRHTLKQLKRAIQAQKATRLAPRRRQFEGEEIDIEAAVNHVCELHAGRAPSGAVYRRRLPNARDTSVVLLADLSTSIMQLLPRGGGRLVDRVRAGVLLFAESLEEVGDAYSIGGFCSRYRDNVTWFTIKDFDEPLSARVRETVGGLSGRLATRMGAAIRHAVRRFRAVESRRRLLLIVSDGRPEDYDDGGDRRYLQEDTRMAVKEAVANGVHPFCITVDAHGQGYLPQIFGKGHYLVLDRMDRLPARLPEIYLRLRR